MHYYKGLAPFKAISLDLDDTLWPNYPVLLAAEQRLLRHLQQVAPAVAYGLGLAGLEQIRNQLLSAQPKLALDLTDLRRQTLLQACRQQGCASSLVEPTLDLFITARSQVRLFAGAEAFLDYWSQRLPLIALSNGNADLRLAGLSRFFQADIRPPQLNASKPNRRLFDAAAQAAGIHNHELLHIGDDIHTDIQGALAAGCQALWFGSGDYLGLWLPQARFDDWQQLILPPRRLV